MVRHRREQSETRSGKCGAGIVSGDLLGNAYYLGVRFTVVPERKFGPYRSAEEARAALKDAGWTKLTDDYYKAVPDAGRRRVRRATPFPTGPLSFGGEEIERQREGGATARLRSAG